MKKAWLVRYDGTDGICAAQTRGEALFHAIANLRDLGSRASVHNTTARRAPDFDQWAELDSTGVCWDANALPRNTARTA